MKSVQKAPVIISTILAILLLASLLVIFFSGRMTGGYIADIYQNGNLIRSIPLYQVTDSYSFELHGENGCTNVIEVRPGSIAIVSADCPDKLCVHQGAISNSLLPITCLPNRVVIQLRTLDTITTDIITY